MDFRVFPLDEEELEYFSDEHVEDLEVEEEALVWLEPARGGEVVPANIACKWRSSQFMAHASIARWKMDRCTGVGRARRRRLCERLAGAHTDYC